MSQLRFQVTQATSCRHTNYNGENGGNQTILNHVLNTYDLQVKVAVRDVIAHNSSAICAEYVEDGFSILHVVDEHGLADATCSTCINHEE